MGVVMHRWQLTVCFPSLQPRGLIPRSIASGLENAEGTGSSIVLVNWLEKFDIALADVKHKHLNVKKMNLFVPLTRCFFFFWTVGPRGSLFFGCCFFGGGSRLKMAKILLVFGVAYFRGGLSIHKFINLFDKYPLIYLFP